MKRLFVLTVLALVLGAGSAFAQTRSTEQPSIRQSIAAAVAHTPLNAAVTRTRAAASGKSFWRTPWPYAIIGAAAVVLIVSTSKNTPVGGY